MRLRYQSVHFYLPRGRLQVWRIFLFNFRLLGTGRVYRVPGFLSSRPNWLPPFTRMRVLPPPHLWFQKGGGHTSWRERGVGEEPYYESCTNALWTVCSSQRGQSPPPPPPHNASVNHCTYAMIRNILNVPTGTNFAGFFYTNKSMLH